MSLSLLRQFGKMLLPADAPQNECLVSRMKTAVERFLSAKAGRSSRQMGVKYGSRRHNHLVGKTCEAYAVIGSAREQ
jgi:hypothetical protein